MNIDYKNKYLKYKKKYLDLKIQIAGLKMKNKFVANDANCGTLLAAHEKQPKKSKMNFTHTNWETCDGMRKKKKAEAEAKKKAETEAKKKAEADKKAAERQARLKQAKEESNICTWLKSEIGKHGTTFSKDALCNELTNIKQLRPMTGIYQKNFIGGITKRDGKYTYYGPGTTKDVTQDLLNCIDKNCKPDAK